jgi:hypothetical protein
LADHERTPNYPAIILRTHSHPVNEAMGLYALRGKCYTLPRIWRGTFGRAYICGREPLVAVR